ncbi:DUF4129 domain protein [Natrialba magadii ATCC 43099]|nr:DUF4129 domain-containing protein [Natrialba magadii]ADD06119.1 DUF4129 domain protein [Natrialba magadii ATCC 43099]
MLLSLFGIDLESATSGSAPGSSLEVLFTVAHAAYPIVLLALIVLVVGATGVFSRRRLPSSTLALAPTVVNPRWWARKPAENETPADSWPPETAPDEATREWLELIEGIDASSPRSRTPAEWATEAVDSGYDESSVETVTQRFREARYGSDCQASSRNRTPTDADEPRDV